MSIFDVIKYPISTPPTKEELLALPEDLFINFLMEANWHTGYDILQYESREMSIKEDIDAIVSKYSNGNFSGDIVILRRMIKGYNEPV